MIYRIKINHTTIGLLEEILRENSLELGKYFFDITQKSLSIKE